jgi:hypothetical protein
MSFIDKLRHAPAPLQQDAGNGRTSTVTAARAPLHATASSKATATATASGRFSNGLKEFLWQLEDLGRGNLLDLGQVSQNTLNFFIERNFKVYTEDVLVAWRDFVHSEDERTRRQTAGPGMPDNSKGDRAERFLASNLNHSADSFDAVLLWDVLDYLDREIAGQLMQRLSSVVRDGGAVLAIFHTRTPEQFHRYRVLDALNLDPVEVRTILPAQRVYQNREIQDLFSRFRTSKTFVGRDQLREIVFGK